MPNDLEALWLPFTPNGEFKRRPRLIAGAKGVYYYGTDGRAILDGSAGLWCVNAGHCREPIVAAIVAQAASLDFAPTFMYGHPKVFELASRIAALAPDPLNHVFFCNSGSEAADTALKIALAYHRAKGAATRTRLIGRERGYHGVGFGGISVGGMVNNRRAYGSLLAGVDHLPHTWQPDKERFVRGQPEQGADLADALDRLVALHGAETIAAVIVEPMAGSTGVLPPPKGYLERLRKACDAHGILLIFDEVITGFGRLGAAFAAERFGVVPDLLTFAKGVTNGNVPMGGVLVADHVHQAFMGGPDHVIDLYHGYTYSGHPLAAAAGLATLDLYRDEGLFDRARALEKGFEDRFHALASHPLVTDVRNMGLAGAIDLDPVAGAPGKRGFVAGLSAFHDQNLLLRMSGDTLALSPPLIVTEDQLDQIFDQLRKALDAAL